MKQNNLCDSVNEGDIIFFKDEKIQVYSVRKTIVGRQAIIDVGYGMHASEASTFDMFCEHKVKPGNRFKYRTNGLTGKFYDYITIAQRDIKTIPAGFVGGELSVDKFRAYILTHLLKGDPELYTTPHNKEDWTHYIEMEYAVIVPAQMKCPKPSVNLGFSKLDLIAYVIYVNDHLLDKATILKKVAELEGKPYVPTSNHDFFQGNIVRDDDAGILQKISNGRGRVFYDLGKMGYNRASAVVTQIGAPLGRL